MAGLTLNASFTVAVSGLTATITDTSTGQNPPFTITSIDWGDNTMASPSNLSHTYAEAGTYTVSVTETDYAGNSLASTQQVVVAAAGPAVPSFTVSAVGLAVQFTDTSTPGGAPITGWSWDFGDGSPAVTTQNPVHTYSAPGTYTVTLSVTDSGVDSSGYPDAAVNTTQQVTVANVVAPTPPTPSFSAVISGLNATFTDTSTTQHPPIVAWNWSFGDGVTATGQNQTHTYAQSGTYTVSLGIEDYSGNTIYTVSQQVTVASVGSPVSSQESIYVLKGFLAYGPFCNNVPEETAPFGELSAQSITFATDRGNYVNNADPEVVMTTFLSANTNPLDPNASGADTGSTDFLTYQAPPAAYITTGLSIGSWLYSQAAAGTLATDSTTLANNMIGEFAGLITGVTVGPYGDATGSSFQAMPEWVTYTQVDGTNTNVVKFWLSDAAFQGQYDQFTIRVVTPVANLDDFFQSSAAVKAEIATITLQQIMVRAQQVQNGQPYSIISTYEFGYLDPLNPNPSNPANFTDVPWTVLIYGAAGDNIDSVKQALINYILANSTHTESQWAAIFPDIFNTTEFILTPMWDQYAAPNLSTQAGVYSPIVDVTAARSIAEQTAQGVSYTASYVDTNVAVVATTYASLSMLAVGSPTNRNGIVKFTQQFPDYMAIPTSSLDYNRMSPNTQAWITLLMSMLLVAEKMTLYSDIPSGMTRLVRGNIMYVVANYQNVDYLVVSKQSLETIVPVTPSTNGSAPAPAPAPTHAPAPNTLYMGEYSSTNVSAFSTTATNQLPNATAGNTYVQQFSIVNGVAPYVLSLAQADTGTAPLVNLGDFTLPAGSGLATLTVAIDQSAPASTQTFHLTVTDASGNTFTAPLAFNVAAASS